MSGGKQEGTDLLRSIALAAAAAILGACQQAGETPAEANQSAAGNAIAAEGIPEEAIIALPTTPPPSREAALEIMHDRHENYEKMGEAMKLVTRQLKGETPDLVAINAGARTIATFAPQIPSWFPPGTGPDVGKTEAKAEIWQRPRDFEIKAAAFNKAASEFYGAAQGTDLAAIRAAHGNLGKTCKACHDVYREEH